MRNPEDSKIVIIGMGFLMEYLYPCYEKYLSPEKLPDQVIAVTADKENLQKKRDQFPFKVYLEDNMKALKELHPDIILFAPPPTVAPMLTETVLKPYFEYARENQIQIPDIYAFPPSPPGKYYVDLLGDDTHVCNILPNMVNEVGGRKLDPTEGITLITYPNDSPWPTENRKRIEDFFSPISRSVDVKPEHVLHVLGTLVCVNLLPLMIFEITDTLTQTDSEVTHNQLASIIRNRLQENQNYHVENSVKCEKNILDPTLEMVLEKIFDAWYNGVVKYATDIGIDNNTINTILTSATDILLQTSQVEARETIESNTANYATKGGVLERGCLCFDAIIRHRVREVLSKGYDSVDDSFYDWLEKVAIEVATIVGIHGKRLSGDPVPVEYSPEMHAVLWGLFVKNARQISGEKGESAVIKGLINYAHQRGGRMAKRAESKGDALTDYAYNVYGEWTCAPEQMEVKNVQDDPCLILRVYKCPWCITWKRFGFMDEGKLYCKYIDEELVKGFNENIDFTVASTQPEGNEYCEFIWGKLRMDEEKWGKMNQQKNDYQEYRLKNWEYHTQHLFKTVSENLVESLENGSEVVDKTYNDFEVIYGSDCATLLITAVEIDFNQI